MIECAAYHGGDFNGVCCRRLLGNAAPIVSKLRAITKVKKDESCEESAIHEKLDEFEITLGITLKAHIMEKLCNFNEKWGGRRERGVIL